MKSQTKDPSINLTRLIDAPPERVWEAWRDPEQMKLWFAPFPWTLSIEKLSFKTGGSFEMTMHGPNGESHGFSGTYDEVTKATRIFWTGKFAEGPIDQVVTRVEFVPEGAKTKILVRQTYSPVTPETRPFIEGANPGWNMTLDQLEATVGDGVFVLVRDFAASRERVWKAWTDVEELKKWFGPKGFKMHAAKMDLRAGGSFHYGLTSPEGQQMWGLWKIRRVEAPSLIQHIQSFSDANGGLTRHPMAKDWPLEMLATTTFEAVGKDKTRMTLRWGAHDASEAEAKVFRDNFKSMEGGWAGTMAQLDEYLAKP